MLKRMAVRANIEDYIRVINELICGLEVLGHDIATGEERNRYDQLLNNLKQIIGNFAEDISEVEYSIATAREEQRRRHLITSSTFL